MNSKLIIHSKYAINYAKFLNHSKSLPQFCNNGEQYFQHHNSYLIPYHCKSVNNKTNLIIGNFIYPMWNTLESIILNKETTFNYNYIMGDKFTVEMTPKYLKNYHILNEAPTPCQKKYRMYPNRIYACDMTLEPNSILLFPIHKDMADILIQTKLL